MPSVIVLTSVSLQDGRALSRMSFPGLGLLGMCTLLLSSLTVGAQQANQRNPNPGATNTATADATPSITVLGRVINAVTGQPVPRALVHINNRSVLSDHDGKFLFPQVTDSNVQLTVNKPGYFATMDPQEPGGLLLRLDQPLPGTIELRLYPEALLTGTVTAPDGTPLQHVQIRARRGTFDDQGLHWNTTGGTQTDSHGNFRLPVASGDYKLELHSMPRMDLNAGEMVMPVTLPEADSAEKLNALHLHSGKEQHFDLRPITSKTYKVTGILDSTLERAFPSVSARSSDGTFVPVNMNGGANGEFRIDLPFGSYTLTANLNSQDASLMAQTNVTVAAHDVSGVVFHFTAVPMLPVEMIAESPVTTPVSSNGLQRFSTPLGPQQFNMFLQRVNADTNFGEGSVRLFNRPDKSFVFNTPPGTYRVKCYRNGGEWYIKGISYGTADLMRQDLVVAPGAGGVPIRITVSNASGSLTGTVKTGETTGRSWVYLIASEPSAYPVISQGTAENGTYTFDRVPPGSYRVVAIEHHRSLDLTDPAVLATFGAHVRSVTLAVGDKPSLDLDAVLATEAQP